MLISVLAAWCLWQVYVWQFRTSFSKVLSTDVTGVKRKDVREKLFHIDEADPSKVGGTSTREEVGREYINCGLVVKHCVMCSSFVSWSA